jgi:hypothetical protein
VQAALAASSNSATGGFGNGNELQAGYGGGSSSFDARSGGGGLVGSVMPLFDTSSTASSGGGSGGAADGSGGSVGWRGRPSGKGDGGITAEPPAAAASGSGPIISLVSYVGGDVPPVEVPRIGSGRGEGKGKGGGNGSSNSSGASPEDAPAAIELFPPEKYSGLRAAKYVGPRDREGKPHGAGTMDYPSGATYAGTFDHGKRQGNGLLVFPDSSRYSGPFMDGKFHGKGAYKWADGRMFQGMFVKGMLTTGQYTWADGRIYIGRFVDDKYQGPGKLHWPDGTWYEGTWERGVRVGWGALTLPNGTRCVGVNPNSPPLQNNTKPSSRALRRRHLSGFAGCVCVFCAGIVP